MEQSSENSQFCIKGNPILCFSLMILVFVTFSWPVVFSIFGLFSFDACGITCEIIVLLLIIFGLEIMIYLLLYRLNYLLLSANEIIYNNIFKKYRISLQDIRLVDYTADVRDSRGRSYSWPSFGIVMKDEKKPIVFVASKTYRKSDIRKFFQILETYAEKYTFEVRLNM